MMSGRPEKRRRAGDNEDASKAWGNIVKYICLSDGMVHSSLTFSSLDRSVRTTSDVSVGCTLMQIPSSCLLSGTSESLTTTEYGRQLTSTVDLAAQYHLHNDPTDLKLALFMAHAAHSNINPAISAYLATLPQPKSYNGIPRRWSDEQLSSLLGGTSLFHRVKIDQKNLKNDYDAVSATWKDETITLPTFQQFDDMFSAVSSRGFAGLGSDDGKSDAMVPLLDLLNHRRGIGGKKDVRYRRRNISTDNGTDSTNAAIVEVVADRDLPAGSILHDTYGAKGNAQLLSRYGFCIENNVEPDGSSNDVVKFIAKEGYPAVELRAGPKAYTYGGFVRALAAFLDDGKAGAGDGRDIGGTSYDDDMMSFINECDDEEQVGSLGMMYGSNMDGAESDKGNDDHVSAESIKDECAALERLSAALGKARESYSLKDTDLQDGLDKKDFSPEYCAAVLVNSERRTLQFFQLAAEKIRHLLEGANESISKNEEDPMLAQVDSLVAAYAAIRHDVSQ